MNRVIIRFHQRNPAELRVLEALLADDRFAGQRAQLDQGKTELVFDLEGSERIRSLRLLFAFVHVLRESELGAEIHHLIEDEEDPEDPITEIDLELLEMAVTTMLDRTGSPNSRHRQSHYYSSAASGASRSRE